MITKIEMPRIVEDATVGRIKWFISQGDTVKRGVILGEIEVDKAVFEVECPHDGIVAKIVAEEGRNVSVGEVLAIIATGDEDISTISG